MLELAPVVLAPGVKGFFENPGYLLGTPLVILGVIGVLIALSPLEIRWPQRREIAVAERETKLEEVAEGHPDPAEYVRVALGLVVLELLELVVFYFDALGDSALAFLLLLTVLQFALVAMWFMHLRFDSRLFSMLFVGGLILVAALFMIVLASLGASLV